MARRSSLTTALLVALSVFAAEAGALSISMDPALTILSPGESVDIARNVSGLGDGAAPSLSAYDIDVAWDASVVQLDAVVLGDPLLGGQLDLGVFGSLQTISAATGAVSLLEVSLESAGDLNSLQAGSFTLATLIFQAIDFGTSAITPSVNSVRDAFGSPLLVDTITGATVSAIPEPSTAILLAVGLLMMGMALRRRAAFSPAA